MFEIIYFGTCLVIAAVVAVVLLVVYSVIWRKPD